MRRGRNDATSTTRTARSALTVLLKEPSGAAMLTLSVMAISAILLVFTPYPVDDFLRHARYLDYRAVGGYEYMYPKSTFSVFPGSPWFGFDYAAGTLLRTIGPHMTIKVLVTSFALLLFIAMIKAMRFPEQAPDHSAATPIFMALSVMLVTLVRVSTIRPSIMLGILFIMSLNGRRATSGFLMAGASACMHHLFYIYTAPLALAHYLKGGRRFSYGIAAGTVAGIAAWNIMTHGATAMYELNQLRMSIKPSNVGPMEARFSLIMVANYATFLTCMLFAMAVAKNRRFDFHTTLILLTAPYALQARFFVDLTLPLMVIYAHNNLDIIQQAFTSARRITTTATILFTASIALNCIEVSRESMPVKLMEGIDFPKGSTVYTDPISHLYYPLVFWNPGQIHVMPSPELRSDTEETQQVSRAIMYTKVVPQEFCYYAARNDITHLMTVLPQRTNCLMLQESVNLGTKIADIWLVSRIPLGPIPPQAEFLKEGKKSKKGE